MMRTQPRAGGMEHPSPMEIPGSRPGLQGLGMGLWVGWIGLCLLAAPAWAAKPRITVLPFVTTDSSSPSMYTNVSRKVSAKLKAKGMEVVAADAKSRQTQVKLPGKADFLAWKKTFEAGKALLRAKKPDKAKVKLEAALKLLPKALMHIKEFDQVMELHRLLGLSYFRMGMGEDGEGVIRQLGALVPRYKFSVTKMPPAMGRVLKRAQKRAVAAKNKLVLTVPAGSSLQFNKVKSQNVSGEVPIKGLAAGKHYLWVRKEGHLPFAKQITVKKGTTKLTIDLKPLPKAGGPNVSPQVAKIRGWLKRRALPRSLGTAAQKIADSLGVPHVLMGYFHKSGGFNNLHMFVYRKSDQTLKLYPPVQFDNELLELDIKLVTLSSKLKAALLKTGTWKNQPWMQNVSSLMAPPRRAVVAVRRAPPPRRRAVVVDDDDDDDDDLDNPKDVQVVGGPKIVRRAPPPRRVAVARPAPRRAAPRPRPVAPRPRPAAISDDDDDDDFDSDGSSRAARRRAAPRPRPAPAPRRVVQPPPRRVVEPPPRRVVAARPAPRRVVVPVPPATRSLQRDQDAFRRDRSAGRVRRSRRVARAVRKTRPFDPDRDVDWSNPIPQAPARSSDDDDDPPPARAPIRPAPVRPAPVRPTPRPAPRTDDDDDDPPARRAATPPPSRRDGDDWSSRPTPLPDRRTPPPTRGGVTRKWWFWTVIGVGSAAAAGAVIGLAVIHSGPGQAFTVHINPNPPGG